MLQRSVAGCAVVTVDGHSYRYTLTHRKRGHGTVLVDVGGPGVAVLGAAYPHDLVADLAPRNVLLIDEPWTTAPTLPGCDEALRAWFGALRRSWPEPNQTDVDAGLKAVLHDCDVLSDEPVWGFTPESYRHIVAAIERDRHVGFTSFYGLSFASARLAYLGATIPGAVLASPFPVGMAARNYLRLRDGTHGPPVPPGIVGQRVPHRSRQLTRLDVDAARVESLYLPPASRPRVLSGPDAAAKVGRLSDQLFGRYGVDSISHAMLAYWQETCPALSGWRAADTTHFGLPGQLLRICQLAAERGWMPTVTRPIKRPTCVAEVRGDGIVTAPMSHWLMRRYGWTVSRWVDGGHASSLGLTRCLVSGSRPAT